LIESIDIRLLRLFGPTVNGVPTSIPGYIPFFPHLQQYAKMFMNVIVLGHIYVVNHFIL
jgi:hypothetical protein